MANGSSGGLTPLGNSTTSGINQALVVVLSWLLSLPGWQVPEGVSSSIIFLVVSGVGWLALREKQIEAEKSNVQPSPEKGP